MSASILIVDDEVSILNSLSSILEDEGYDVSVAKSGMEALKHCAMNPPELMMLDIWMPEMDGLETLKRLRELVPNTQVMMMSGHGSIETAVKAIKLGAYDYIEKPLSLENVTLRVKHALDQHRLEQENRSLRTKVERKFELIGQAPVMQQLKQLIETAGPTNSRVLIGGENGTGKELVARAIHQHSHRATRPFVAVNCAAIPETLIESELFGHERGAFSGATTMKRGQFEQADGGTLFLDEIADMSLSTQAKVLRALQEQQFTRVGGTKLIKVDVRVLAASNKDLLQEIEKGTFREDLFYRLNVVPIVVPTLRDRREDIPLLVKHFLRVHAEEQGLKIKQVSPEAMDVFMQYEWPGNIRELRNLIERLMIMVPGPIIEAAHASVALQVRPQPLVAPSAAGAQPANTLLTRPYDSLRDARNAFEKEFIARKLREHHWNISRTAEDLKIERSHLHRKIKLLDVEMRPEM
ncbi:MAG TPA: sigma-54 dependent transcriptional regulator [Nitrospira sp.]|nr:sigma-54-dependent Fis family transcriptional regulator [Nitrospira sp.]MBS0173351.1 sigma-54-dependent Fis family transcriptional regulator [Nitrospira sp.]MBX3336496.1 sigma-54-dependent Fis family transcriptional regulator [Nitrospira sp.]MCW5779029.1 sigma-54-dependent Fis family transcriptional regulator [Nitrospira sp.]HMZ54265.1 sigma-54 dependent transcriptional regulator [Nitrospira sp.]